MTKELLFTTIGGISDEYVEQVWNCTKKDRSVWKRWWPAAACFGLAAVITVSVLSHQRETVPAQDTEDSYTVSFVQENGEKPTVISLSYSDIADGENIPVIKVDGKTVKALNVASDTSDATVYGTMTMEEAERYAYMDIDEAPGEIKELILAARKQIIYSKSWAADGVVGIVKHADGTEEQIPAFSELFPGWDLPVEDTGSEYTEEGLNCDVQYGLSAEVIEIQPDYMICKPTMDAYPFKSGQIIKVYYPENGDISCIAEGEELIIGYMGRDYDLSDMTIRACSIDVNTR